jgi:hypothetical protein
MNCPILKRKDSALCWESFQGRGWRKAGADVADGMSGCFLVGWATLRGKDTRIREVSRGCPSTFEAVVSKKN